MDTFGDIIDLWPNAEAFAADVGVTGVVARAWKRRNSIPPGRWIRICEAAAKRGYPVTLADMARISALAEAA